jgi:hypothetical protein
MSTANTLRDAVTKIPARDTLINLIRIFILISNCQMTIQL